eukprot:5178248-Pleurochrysis_carterae.AAC.3
MEPQRSEAAPSSPPNLAFIIREHYVVSCLRYFILYTRITTNAPPSRRRATAPRPHPAAPAAVRDAMVALRPLSLRAWRQANAQSFAPP